MLVYDAPVVDRPHFLEKNMLQSNRRHWFDQVFSLIQQKLAMLVAEMQKRMATPETRYYGDSVKVGWVAGHLCYA